ncbi:hypothetical protein GCM10007927_41130 [Sulfitobacter pacificus]|uniref:Phosphatidic acid phosphatase type 2/haloperoxidase domain-containing protein n=3 Tax=Sulfitobacter pacificus TaxID=1499314 RepID=A0ABQ5VQ75_9RHOB|nr:hypothetical protein GCM10007927_41130 [Sulfitobacter pacificus]
MLNTALTITSDAIVGYWDGTFDMLPQALPKGHETLSYLTPQRRKSMLAAEALGYFSVTDVSGSDDVRVRKEPFQAGVLYGGAEIHKVETPSYDFFKEQLKWLRNYADLRVDRIPEINAQIVDLLSFFGMVGQLDAGEHKHTLEALGVVQDVTYSVTMQVKHHCWAPRPIAFSRRVHPMIQTPDHSSFPSAHASEAFAIATVLEHLMRRQSASGSGPSMALRVAQRIAVNRTIAGVHFPADSFAGAQLGIAMGHAMIALLFNGVPKSTVFRPQGADANFGENDDFLLSDLMKEMANHSDAETKIEQPPFARIYGEQIYLEWPEPDAGSRS